MTAKVSKVGSVMNTESDSIVESRIKEVLMNKKNEVGCVGSGVCRLF